jgi:hypothetical protein
MAEHSINSAPRQRVPTGRTSGDEEAALVNENEHSQISEKPQHPHHLYNVPDTEGMYRFWRRFTRRGKKNIGVMQSLRAFLLSSCMFPPNIPERWEMIQSMFRAKPLSPRHASCLGFALGNERRLVSR